MVGGRMTAGDGVVAVAVGEGPAAFLNGVDREVEDGVGRRMELWRRDEGKENHNRGGRERKRREDRVREPEKERKPAHRGGRRDLTTGAVEVTSFILLA